MAGDHHNNTHASRMDHVNRFQSEPQPFGPKLFMHSRTDAANGALSSGYGGTPIRPYILSSRQTAQSHIQHSSIYSGYPHAGSSSSIYAPHNTHHRPAFSYPHRSEDNFIPSSHIDDRRGSLKRRNPTIHPVDGINIGSCYAGRSSNPQFPRYMPPNHIPAPEPCPPRIASNMGSSYWSDHSFGSHGGYQRNVRGHHDHNPIHLGHNPGVPCASNITHWPPYHTNVIDPPRSTTVPQDRAHFSIPPRVTAPGTNGNSSIVFRERPYYSAPQRTSINAPPVSTPHLVPVGYAPRAVPPNTTNTYPASAPAFATSNNLVTVTHEPDIPCYWPAVPGYPPAVPSYPPASAATSRVRAESTGENNFEDQGEEEGEEVEDEEEEEGEEVEDEEEEEGEEEEVVRMMKEFVSQQYKIQAARTEYLQRYCMQQDGDRSSQSDSDSSSESSFDERVELMEEEEENDMDIILMFALYYGYLCAQS